MSTRTEAYVEEVKAAMYQAMLAGHCEFEEVLRYLGSVDPRVVKSLFAELKSKVVTAQAAAEVFQRRGSAARRKTAYLPLQFPASDPVSCQWWFTVDAAEYLAKTCWTLSEGGPVAFLGTPTVGYYFAHWFDQPSSILDADNDVLAALGNVPQSDICPYDVANEPEGRMLNKHTVALVDPPWYQDSILSFLARSRQLLRDSAYLLCIIPPRLTRPGLIEERNDLLRLLLDYKFEVVSIETGCAAYYVPEFEARAYQDIGEFTGRQWRRGDLLVLKVSSESHSVLLPDSRVHPTMRFSRDPQKIRFFLAPDKCNSTQTNWMQPVREFENNVSRNSAPAERLTVWGTNRRALTLRELGPCERILQLWKEGLDLGGVQATLRKEGIEDADAVCSLMQEALQLWSDLERPIVRRNADSLKSYRERLLSKFAAQPSPREYENADDGFRLPFQRDRDRILWSQSLRALANKTQLFPVDTDDQQRRRLSHSIEVMQLAATIAYGFGLDRDLTEAGALAHDIGHCAFGHAGEFALNNVLNEVSTRLGGFNHYAHGVDVVVWLDSPYISPGIGEIAGLDLTKETRECIIKHTFFRDNEILGQSTVIRNSKYDGKIEDTSCHLEGQAVRIADKVSYLISDLEDGIRVGAFDYGDLARCKFFQRAPIDMKPCRGETMLARFVSQRRALLKVIMEDIMNATDRRLADFDSLAAIREERGYVVGFSPELEVEVTEIWEYLQAGKLHSHPEVKNANLKAAKTIRCLFINYAAMPGLVDSAFRQSHEAPCMKKYMEWYRTQVGGEEIGVPKRLVAEFSLDKAIGTSFKEQGDNYQFPLQQIVMAKDYVASLTDIRASEEYRKILQTM